MKKRMPSGFLTPEGPLDELISTVMRGLPSKVKTEDLPVVVYNLRQKLADKLLEENPQEDMEHENFLRDALPPLWVEPGPMRPIFSPWRTGINALIGLLLGAAAAQAGQAAGAAAVLAALAGLIAGLWLAEKLAEAAANPKTTIFSWPLKKIKRWLPRLWVLILTLALARDFVQARDTLSNFIFPLREFLESGLILGIFNNIYWSLLIAAVYFMAAMRPSRLDRKEFASRLRHACLHWWAGAENLSDAISDKKITPPSENRELMAAFTQELASFAAELDPVRQSWLEEKLDSLGFTAVKTPEFLTWSQNLRDTFEPVGHLEEGDPCFIDLAPLYDDNRIIRKGTVRKVRA